MVKRIERKCENCAFCLIEEGYYFCFNGNLADIFINGAPVVSATDTCKSFSASNFVLAQMLKEKQKTR